MRMLCLSIFLFLTQTTASIAHNFLIECRKGDQKLMGVVNIPNSSPQKLFGDDVIIEKKERFIIGSSLNKQFLINIRTGAFSPELGVVDKAVECKVTNMRHE